MNLRVEKVKEKEKSYQVGDILEILGTFSTFYVILLEDEGFIARSLHGKQGLTGHHSTNIRLINSIENDYKARNITHYSIDEYELVLKPKSE